MESNPSTQSGLSHCPRRRRPPRWLRQRGIRRWRPRLCHRHKDARRSPTQGHRNAHRQLRSAARQGRRMRVATSTLRPTWHRSTSMRAAFARRTPGYPSSLTRRLRPGRRPGPVSGRPRRLWGDGIRKSQSESFARNRRCWGARREPQHAIGLRCRGLGVRSYEHGVSDLDDFVGGQISASSVFADLLFARRLVDADSSD